MRLRDLLLTLNGIEGPTLMARVARSIQEAILGRRLLPGAALPGTRALAEMLDVDRKTVMVALQDLEVQGWVVTLPNRGTFVAAELPMDVVPVVESRDSEIAGSNIGFDPPSWIEAWSAPRSQALFSLADGLPDARLAPAEELAKAYQRALRRHADSLLRDGSAFGLLFLREAVSDWIAERQGVRISPDRILISRGSRGALAVFLALLSRTQGVAAVENPGNRGAWDLIRRHTSLGIRPVPVDASGLDIEHLESLMRKEQVRVIYATTRCQFPTGAVLSDERAEHLLATAAFHRTAIVEDDLDAEIHYSNRRSRSLLARDQTGQVVQIGSLSRLLAPGLRIGYLVIPPPLVPVMGRLRQRLEEQGDPALEWAVADLMRDGELARHLRRSRKAYRERRDLLMRMLLDRFRPWLDITCPEAGMALWVRCREGVAVSDWLQAAREGGVDLDVPSRFFLGAEAPHFRIGFSQVDAVELAEVVSRLGMAWDRRDHEKGKPQRGLLDGFHC